MIEAGCNLNKVVLRIKHTDLERSSEESPFRSLCPVCKQGFLLVRRHGTTLSHYDNCILCGQHFIYLDDSIAGLALID